MFKIQHLLFFFLSFLPTTSIWASRPIDNKELCKKILEVININLPIRKDNITVVKNAGCLPRDVKPLLIYMVEIDAPFDLVKNIYFEREMKPDTLRTYCTDPKIRISLNAMDVDWRYYTKEGDYVGSFSLSAKECKK